MAVGGDAGAGRGGGREAKASAEQPDNVGAAAETSTHLHLFYHALHMHNGFMIEYERLVEWEGGGKGGHTVGVGGYAVPLDDRGGR